MYSQEYKVYWILRNKLINFSASKYPQFFALFFLSFASKWFAENEEIYFVLATQDFLDNAETLF